MADLVLVKGKRFADDFSIAAAQNYTPTASEAAYVKCLTGILDRLAAEKPEPTEFADELEALRVKLCGTLRQGAEAVTALGAGAARDAGADEAASYALWLEGVYDERRLGITTIPFKVKLEGSPATDLVIDTLDVNIPEDKQAFKVELDRVVTVLKAVLGDQHTGRWTSARKKKLNEWKLDDYLRALAGIARVGLSGHNRTQVPFAKLALSGFKDEVVAREAAQIKNGYVLTLGIWAFVAMATSIAIYIFLYWCERLALVPQANFLWLWAGAAAGAWLSFSIRRVVLSFDDLALLEEDRLKPVFRILFVIVLTTVVGLFFWTELVSVTIGKFATNFAGVGNRDVAFLIGAFCGLSERSMSSAVARRAEDFAVSVGGTQKKPTP